MDRAHEITISYEVNNRSTIVMLSYEIEQEDNIQTINCTVNPGSFQVPAWLHLRKFEVRSIVVDDGYMPLFTDHAQVINIDAEQFIDQAYKEIMEKEHFRVM